METEKCCFHIKDTTNVRLNEFPGSGTVAKSLKKLYFNRKIVPCPLFGKKYEIEICLQNTQ